MVALNLMEDQHMGMSSSILGTEASRVAGAAKSGTAVGRPGVRAMCQPEFSGRTGHWLTTNVNDKQLSDGLGSLHLRQPLTMSMSVSAPLAAASFATATAASKSIRAR